MFFTVVRFFAVVALFLQLFSHRVSAQRTILSAGCSSSLAETACINLGARRTSVGPFMAMRRNVALPSSGLNTYRLRGSITGTEYPGIFTRHFRERDVTIGVKVPPERSFDVTLHTIEARFCTRGGVDAFIQAGTNSVRSDTVNGFKLLGCRVAFTISVFNAMSDSNGLLQIRVAGNRGVVLGGICIKRRLMESSLCSQSGCQSFEGCGGLAIAHASLALPGAPCAILESAQATLDIPENAQIAYAALNWAGAGHPRAPSTTLELNGILVKSKILNQDSQFEPYYTAMADVTELVRNIGRGVYVVQNMFYSPYLSCPQAHMAAWSLTVIYGAMGVSENDAKTRVNVCAENTQGSPPLLTLPVNCVLPAPPAVKTTGSFVVFEAEFFTDEFYVNGNLIQTNAFQGRSGEKYDLYETDLTNFVGGRTNRLVFSIADNNDYDYLFFGMRAVVQTLPGTYTSTTARIAHTALVGNDSSADSVSKPISAFNAL